MDFCIFAKVNLVKTEVNNKGSGNDLHNILN